MKHSPFIIIFLVALTILAGCTGSDNNTGRNKQAMDLYQKSKEIGRLYTDSLLHATDSATVERLMKEYDEEMTRLQYQYVPDIGLELTEGENDTLISISDRIITRRDSLLKSFSVKPIEPTDSIE